MKLRKKGYLRQNINLKAYSGQTGWTAGLFFVFVLAVFLMSLMQMEKYRTMWVYLEDTLAASNLASAVVDVEEYGISHTILVDHPDEAYRRYQWAVKENLNLDGNWCGQPGSVIRGPVQIVNYTVYNVRDNMVSVYRYNQYGLAEEWQEVLGRAVAPNGIRIESTSVYSELAFTAQGLWGMEVEARRGHLADVVREP